MKNKKYKIYLSISVAFIFLWVAAWRLKLIGGLPLTLSGALVLFMFWILLEICNGKLTDLDVKEIKDVWWRRIGIIFIVAFIGVNFIVNWNKNYENVIKIIVNSAIFGIFAGYFLRRWEEKDKERKDGDGLIRGLAQEIGGNRFRCQGIAKGTAPIYFDTFLWDNIRLSKYFNRLWSEKKLVNDLFNLYLLLTSANFRINLVQVASNNLIIQPNPQSKTTHDKAYAELINFMTKDVLPKLETMEKRMSEFCKKLY